MRVCTAAALAALVLASCDAGNRASPGDENRLVGPALSIVQPASNRTVASGDVAVMFDLRNARRDSPGGEYGDTVLLFVDDLPPHHALDATKPFRVLGLAAGTHLLRAVVVRQDGTAHRNPEAFAARVFHVERAEPGKWTWRTPDRRDETFDPEREPLLTAWAATNPPSRFVDMVVGNPVRGRVYGVRYAVDGGPATALTEAAKIPLEDLGPGEHRMRVELLEPAGSEVAPVPGRPFAAQDLVFVLP